MFETHSWSEDNDRRVATGWLPCRLSPRGRNLAEELGDRRRNDGLAAVLVSDLRRATETAEIAFAATSVPVLHDWRLQECDYGEMNGQLAAEVRGAVRHVRDRYPGGESWADAIERVGGVVADIPKRWVGQRVLVIGHMSAYWALEHYVRGVPLSSRVGRTGGGRPAGSHRPPRVRRGPAGRPTVRRSDDRRPLRRPALPAQLAVPHRAHADHAVLRCRHPGHQAVTSTETPFSSIPAARTHRRNRRDTGGVADTSPSASVTGLHSSVGGQGRP